MIRVVHLLTHGLHAARDKAVRVRMGDVDIVTPAHFTHSVELLELSV
jgi:hypothetical protein